MRARQIAIVLLAIGLVLIGSHYLLWALLIRDTLLPEYFSKLLLAAYFVLLVSFIGTRVCLRNAVHWAGWPGYMALGFVSVLFVCVCIAYSARLLIHGGFQLAGIPIDAGRELIFARVFGSAAVISAGVLAVVGVRTAVAEPSVSEMEIPLARLPRELDGYTIVQISDVHLGRTIGRAFAERTVRIANALGADLISITGDLVDGSIDQLRDVVAPFGELSARHGVWLVTGNHEYYVGVDFWIQELSRMGIRVLRNERVAIGEGRKGFDLAGVDDWGANIKGHGHDLRSALAGRDDSRPLVLLAHQPKTIVEASQMGVDLQISGHTHGGQIWPGSWLVRLQQPYIAGLHLRGDTYLYVNRGTGYWGPPMRVGPKPEIARLVLRSASGASCSDGLKNAKIGSPENRELGATSQQLCRSVSRYGNKWMGGLLAFGGIAAISTDSLFTRLAEVDGFAVTFWVGLFTAVVMLGAATRGFRRSPLPSNRKDAVCLALAAVLQAASMTSFVFAIKHTYISNVVVIVAAAPLFAAAIAWVWLKESTSLRVFLAMTLTATGIMFVVGGTLGHPQVFGDLSAVGSVACFAAGFVLLRKKPSLSPSAVVGWGGVGMMLIGCGAAQVPDGSIRTLLALLAMGAVFGPLGRWMLAVAPKHLAATQVALFAPLEMLFASLWAFLVFREAPASATWWGGAIVVVGVIWGIVPHAPSPSVVASLAERRANGRNTEK